MTTQDIVTAIKTAEPKLLAQIIVNKMPISTLPSGQIIWSEKQITALDQIMVGMVLVRVVGVEQNLEPVIVVDEVFEKRPGSYWYRAIPLSQMDTIYSYSLTDAGVTGGAGGWSENHLLDSGFTVDHAELQQLLERAVAFP
jgi:hypothetical protein